MLLLDIHRRQLSGLPSLFGTDWGSNETLLPFFSNPQGSNRPAYSLFDAHRWNAVIEQWFRNHSAEHLPNHIITQLNEIGNPDNFISQLLIEALIFDVALIRSGFW